ncbi:helix-turn-helix transcriptional regulator [Kineococcus sp. SYSU DK004]|uniref:helix-turn-helix transcriptional regulator n=1 Tax=Kineococcus sp. SYSU DK004 TaxID=3383125 RepID=UPI003D7D3063
MRTAAGHGWTFLTNHAHLLIAVARDPDARVRDLAAVVGVSERAALTILQDLQDAGYLHRHRVGRRNTYTLRRDLPFRHPANAAHGVGELLAIFEDGDGPAGGTGTRP